MVGVQTDMRQKRVIIRTPYPTAEEIARDLRITPREKKRLDQMLAAMQLPGAKRAMKAAFAATPKELGRAAVSKAAFEALVAIEEKLAEFSVQARKVAQDSQLGYRTIARRMGNLSPSTVQRIVSGAAYNATLDTLARFAWACGYDLDVRLRKLFR